MTPDTPPVSVASVAAAGERLRMELLDALRRATSDAQRAAVMTELVMFYGQAFARVYDACAVHALPGLLTARVLHECIRGLAIHKLWLVSETPINPSEYHDQMAGHWRNVTGWVLGATND